MEGGKTTSYNTVRVVMMPKFVHTMAYTTLLDHRELVVIASTTLNALHWDYCLNNDGTEHKIHSRKAN